MIFFKERKLTLKDFTKEQRNIVRDELAERVKDVVFGNALKRVEYVMQQIENTNLLETDTPLNINYTIEMVLGDILQVYSREKRLNENSNTDNKPS